MGLGVGIFLVVLGLIFVLDVINVDLPGIEDNTLGLILLLAGIAGTFGSGCQTSAAGRSPPAAAVPATPRRETGDRPSPRAPGPRPSTTRVYPSPIRRTRTAR